MNISIGNQVTYVEHVSHGMDIFHLNTNTHTLIYEMYELLLFFSGLSYRRDLIIIAETWLSDSDLDFYSIDLPLW
jgi:hypothetical protein